MCDYELSGLKINTVHKKATCTIYRHNMGVANKKLVEYLIKPLQNLSE